MRVAAISQSQVAIKEPASPSKSAQNTKRPVPSTPAAIASEFAESDGLHQSGLILLGLLLFVLGLVKKVWLADQLAPFADDGFAAAIDDVDVAIEPGGESETGIAAADQADISCQAHGQFTGD